MKTKNLVPLVVVLAILVALGVGKYMMTRPPTIEEQVQLPSLLPEGLTSADVAKLQLYAGGKPDEKVLLTRDADDPNSWHVTSHFNAPAKTEEIEEFVDKLVGLKGEFRAPAETDDELEKYNLSDAKGFHVQGFKKDAEEPAFTLLVGKAPAYNQVFMRTAEGQDIFVVDVNLRREANVWQDEPDTAPEADKWLDKTVVEIEKDTITKVEATTPDKRLVFERREKPVEPDETEAPAAEGEDSAEEAAEEPEAAAEPAEEPEVEYEWVLAEGGPGTPHKQDGLDSLLGAFAPLTATTVVDPSKKADWGLETPAFRLAITVEGDNEPTVIEGGRPDADGDGYVRLANAPEDVVYKLSKYTFERVFKKGKDLFNLPGLTVTQDAVDHVELTQPEGRVVLAKQDDKWTVAEPKADLEVQKNTLDTVASTLASWKPDDYADSAADAGLETPSRSVTFTAGPGQSHTIVLGADSKSVAGAYARLDDVPEVLIMSKSNMDRIFVEPKDLYERTVLDIDEFDIKSIEVQRAEDAFVLNHADDAWTLGVDGEEFETDEDAVEDLGAAVADLQASDIRFGESDLGGATHATIRCVMEEGPDNTLVIGEEQDGVHRVKATGTDIVFIVDAMDVADLLPASASLKKPEPEPAPEETESPEAGATEALEPAAGETAEAAPAEGSAEETVAADTSSDTTEAAQPATDEASEAAPSAEQQPAAEAEPAEKP